MKLNFIEKNDDFVVINKPSGMLSIPDRIQSEVSLKEILIQHFGEIFTVHRLDKDTSGLILFARNKESHKYLSEMFEDRKVEKKYVGFLFGKPLEDEFTVEACIAEHPSKNGTMIINPKGKYARTDFKLIENFGLYSFMSFNILTGRTHQIRVHSKHIGHSIICDPVYGDGKPVFVSSIKRNYNLSKNDLEEKPILNRLALHATSLSFEVNGNQFSFEAPIYKDMEALLQQLNKWRNHLKVF